MNPVLEQIVTIYKEMPLARKIVFGVLILMLVAGFTTMFLWANKTEYKVAYTELSETDASAIVEKLKEANTPYKLASGGTTIMVPSGQVYEVRLSMASEGIPKGSGVGYEIFDQTDFGTTEFVQKINKKRAIQGELARTIRAFDEVKEAKVMIVLPKDSVFVEETKKPSASILLELESDLDQGKVAAVAHLVASSIEDLTPKLVTIVDTAGRILFEGKSEEEKSRIEARNLADAQYKYKVRYEKNIADRIQTMLERIVGKDKAIVRVTSELDFSTSSVNEEIYDPFERETTFVRSEKLQAEESTRPTQPPGDPSSVNPVVPPGGEQGQGMARVNKKDDTVNYELSRRTRQTVKPMAVLERLSVAAVVDGKYEYKTDESGNRVRAYVPRSQSEMQQFADIVVKAMGYNEGRQDQVSMECFPFASIDEMGGPEPELKGWRMVQKEYGRTIANLLLVLLLFLFVIRPVIKTIKGIKETVEQKELPGPEERALLEEGREEKGPGFAEMTAEEQKHHLETMSESERSAFFAAMTPADKEAYLDNLSVSEKAAWYARHDVARTANIIKGWLSEAGEEEE
ncbi:MAG: flagellar basal-body MS-ring/collar protein FliF [Desulfobacteraceae bacterium]